MAEIVYVIVKSDGSLMAAAAPFGPDVRRAAVESLKDRCDRTGDVLAGPVEVLSLAEVLSNLDDEIEENRQFIARRDAAALREHLRHVVERWRDKNTGRGV